MASTTSAEPRMSSPGPIQSGSVQTAAKATTVATGVPDPHLGEVAQRPPAGPRTLPASASDDSASRSVRLASSWRTTMAANTTPARTASPSAGVRRVVPRHPLLAGCPAPRRRRR